MMFAQNAISTSDTVDHSVVRLVVNDYRKALTLFEAVAMSTTVMSRSRPATVIPSG